LRDGQGDRRAARRSLQVRAAHHHHQRQARPGPYRHRPGGKNVRAIIEATGCAIDIEDDGRINIASHDGEACQLAIKMIAT